MEEIPPAEEGSSPDLDGLFSELYQQLRRLAHRQRLRHGWRHTLSTTAIVNEAYLRLRAAGRVAPEDRLHFMALCARVMRFVLVDYARRWSAEKRDPGAEAPGAAVDPLAPDRNAESTLAVHDALERLAERSARLARVVECRFFGGMTEAEIAELLGVSERTIRAEWQRAKLWLTRELSPPEAAPRP
jgi:RNA polymerase sigma factor (TIGR02999 family)